MDNSFDDVPSAVLPWLFLGSLTHAYHVGSSLAHLRIARVVKVVGGSLPSGAVLNTLASHGQCAELTATDRHMMYPLSDYGDTKLVGSEKFERVLDFVAHARSCNGETASVHACARVCVCACVCARE